MRSKSEIEFQLEHFRSSCTTDAPERQIWIAALEWVLGDDEHRTAYSNFIASLETFATPNEESLPGDSIARHALAIALERLR